MEYVKAWVSQLLCTGAQRCFKKIEGANHERRWSYYRIAWVDALAHVTLIVFSTRYLVGRIHRRWARRSATPGLLFAATPTQLDHFGNLSPFASLSLSLSLSLSPSPYQMSHTNQGATYISQSCYTRIVGRPVFVCGSWID